MKIKQFWALPLTLSAYISNDGIRAKYILAKDKVHAFINLHDFVQKRTDKINITVIDLNERKSTKYANFSNDTLYITRGGNYKLCGNFEGNIVVDTNLQNVSIILNNVQIISNNGACIQFTENCGKCSIIALKDTENYLADSLVNTSGAINCQKSIKISGEGKLIITGLGGDGIIADSINISAVNLDISASGRVFVSNVLTINNSELVINAEGVSSTSNSTTNCLIMQGSTINRTEYK